MMAAEAKAAQRADCPQECVNSPKSGKSLLGDGTCDAMCNIVNCNYDGLDCEQPSNSWSDAHSVAGQHQTDDGRWVPNDHVGMGARLTTGNDACGDACWTKIVMLNVGVWLIVIASCVLLGYCCRERWAAFLNPVASVARVRRSSAWLRRGHTAESHTHSHQTHASWLRDSAIGVPHLTGAIPTQHDLPHTACASFPLAPASQDLEAFELAKVRSKKEGEKTGMLTSVDIPVSERDGV